MYCVKEDGLQTGRHEAKQKPSNWQGHRAYEVQADDRGIPAADNRERNPSSIGVPFSVARISPGSLKVLDALL